MILHPLNNSDQGSSRGRGSSTIGTLRGYRRRRGYDRCFYLTSPPGFFSASRSFLQATRSPSPKGQAGRKVFSRPSPSRVGSMLAWRILSRLPRWFRCLSVSAIALGGRWFRSTMCSLVRPFRYDRETVIGVVPPRLRVLSVVLGSAASRYDLVPTDGSALWRERGVRSIGFSTSCSTGPLTLLTTCGRLCRSSSGWIQDGLRRAPETGRI